MLALCACRLERALSHPIKLDEIRPVLNWTKWISSQLETPTGTPMVQTAIWDAQNGLIQI